MSAPAMTSERIGFLAIVVFAVAGCPKLPPTPDQIARGRAGVDQYMSSATTEVEINRLVGAFPTHCVNAAARKLLCEWRLGNRQAGWAPLAGAIASTDKLNLICELPADGSPRPRDSCRAFPRRTNSDLVGVRNVATGGEISASDDEALRVHSAKTLLDGAHTALGLSHLLGAAPEECSERGEQRLCIWRVSHQTYGHGLLAASIGASKRKRLVMRCALPLDGGPRGRESCSVSGSG